jgi:multicomponent Na+:H+ antiporter subunit E
MRHRDEADRFRQSVLDLEARIVQAIGSTAERRLISQELTP